MTPDPRSAPSPPFRFFECILMVRPLGIRAANLREFLNGLKAAPVDCIHHHFHQAGLKHQFDIPDYPNDFAQWASLNLEDAALAEKLGNLNPYRYGTLEGLREALCEITEDHLMGLPLVPSVRPGLDFHFCTDTALVSDTGLEAPDLPSFRAALERVAESCLYYHFYEARLRHPGFREEDFSSWFEAGGYPALAERVRSMEIFFLTLRELRASLASQVDLALLKESA